MIQPFLWYQGQTHLSRSNIRVTFFFFLMAVGGHLCFTNKACFTDHKFPLICSLSLPSVKSKASDVCNIEKKNCVGIKVIVVHECTF